RAGQVVTCDLREALPLLLTRSALLELVCAAQVVSRIAWIYVRYVFRWIRVRWEIQQPAGRDCFVLSRLFANCDQLFVEAHSRPARVLPFNRHLEKVQSVRCQGNRVDKHADLSP